MDNPVSGLCAQGALQTDKKGGTEDHEPDAPQDDQAHPQVLPGQHHVPGLLRVVEHLDPVSMLELGGLARAEPDLQGLPSVLRADENPELEHVPATELLVAQPGQLVALLEVVLEVLSARDPAHLCRQPGGATLEAWSEVRCCRTC